jgi:hypothetical protein
MVKLAAVGSWSEWGASWATLDAGDIAVVDG